MVDLRPYQTACVDAVLAAARAGQDRQLVVMPTGTGKTAVFVQLVRMAAGRSLILAHRTELIDQAVEKLLAAGVPPADVGVVKAGENETRRRCIVASVPTLSRTSRLEQLPPDAFSLLIIDEAHHAIADSYRRVLDHFDTRLVVGWTATPDRFDGRGLDELFGAEAVFAYGLREAISDGWLVNIRQFAIQSEVDLGGVHSRGGDFVSSELSGAVNTHLRNKLIVNNWTSMGYGRPTVAFCVDVQHALDLETEFSRQGFHAAVVHAKTPADERRAILASLHDAELDVVTNVGVLCEGWDCPPTSCVIMARPTQSRGLYQQCVGRGLRPHDGKPDCLILDVGDNCRRHKLATIKDLLGTQTNNFEGRTLEEVEQYEREQAKERIAAGSNDWTAEEIPVFLPLMLEDYAPTEAWHDLPATSKQLSALLKHGYDLGNERLTRGEGAHLLYRAVRNREAGAPSSKQAWFLRNRGHDPRNHTFKSASTFIRQIKAAIGG